MGLREMLGNAGHIAGIGHLVSDVTIEYIPCAQQCSRCPDGNCTKSKGHTVIQGHLSSRDFSKLFDKNGCGHSWQSGGDNGGRSVS